MYVSLIDELKKLICSVLPKTSFCHYEHKVGFPVLLHSVVYLVDEYIQNILHNNEKSIIALEKSENDKNQKQTDNENQKDEDKNDSEIDMGDEEDLIESALLLMDEYIHLFPSDMAEPEFHENMIQYVKNAFAFICSEEEEEFSDENEDDDTYDNVLHHAAETFYDTIMPRRSYPYTRVIQALDHAIIEKKIKGLQSRPQPKQRTSEWYTFRYNLITASNAYKAFENQNTQNQLICEKCVPMSTTTTTSQNYKFVNTNSSLHWGQKYEPLSAMFYEKTYKTKIGDFGCIQHDTYNFLGASPDGINVDPNTKRYGRMLEIKNIVNREINGIPKKEYWVQMQLQMEVCDLDECDFLETRFKEYNENMIVKVEEEGLPVETPEQAFYKDGDFRCSAMGEWKGIILYFTKQNGEPHYEYIPTHIETAEDFETWSQETIDQLQEGETPMMWIRNIYWKLEEWSCVLVERNRFWFEKNIPALQHIWSIIEKERQTGYEHRMPKKRMLKSEPNVSTSSSETPSCLIRVNKQTNKTHIISEPSTLSNGVIKIRTQSFDESKTIVLHP